MAMDEAPSVESHHILESSVSETSYTDHNSPSLSFSSSHTESTMNLCKEEESVASWETLDLGFSSNFWTEPFISENALDEDYFSISSYGTEPFYLW